MHKQATKNVLFPFIGDSVGGSHLSDIEVIKRLPGEYEPIMALHSAEGPLKPYLEPLGKKLFYLDIAVPQNFQDIVMKFPEYAKAIFQAARFLKEQKIDIVHCNDGPLRYVWFYAAKRAGARFILVQHGRGRMGLEKRLVYPLFDSIISNSEYTRELLPIGPKRRKSEVAYPIININGIPHDKAGLRVKLFSEEEIGESEALIGFVANIQECKRPEIFISMARNLKNRGLKAKYMMVGALYGDSENKLNQMLKVLDLAEDFIVPGFVKNINQFIQAFDILIAPAVDEPFGRVLVEAMALGTPVVAARSGGHCEIIEDGVTGFLVDPDDPVQFADKVCRLLDDPELRDALVEAAEHEVAERFSPATQMDRILQVYQALG